MLGQAKLVAQMRAQSIMRGELVGNLLGKIGGQSAILVNRYKLQPLGPGLVLQLPGFLGPLRLLAIGLRTDRDIFARSHRHRPGHQPGECGEQDRLLRGGGGGHPDDQTGGRDNPVIRPQRAASLPGQAGVFHYALLPRWIPICSNIPVSDPGVSSGSWRAFRFPTDISMHPSYRPRRSRYWW